MRECCRVKQISNPLGSTKRGQRGKARLTRAKSRFVVRTTALETGLGRLTSNSSRRRSRKQSDRKPLWNRQQQLPDRICEVASENTEVHFTCHTDQQSLGRHPARQLQSLGQESRAFCKTKRHNGIVKSTTTEPVKSLARTTESISQVIPNSSYSVRSRGQPARQSSITALWYRHNAIVGSTQRPVKRQESYRCPYNKSY
jgi:hypothetical protein